MTCTRISKKKFQSFDEDICVDLFLASIFSVQNKKAVLYILTLKIYMLDLSTCQIREIQILNFLPQNQDISNIVKVNHN